MAASPMRPQCGVLRTGGIVLLRAVDRRARDKALQMGYSATDLAAIPEGAISGSVAAIRRRSPRCNRAKRS